MSPEALELREWVIPFGQGAYVALYRIETDQIVILAMRHGREDGYGRDSHDED